MTAVTARTDAPSAFEVELPSLPSVLAALLQETARGEHASVAQIAKLCGNDPAIAVEVLRLSNAPAYYRGQPVTSVHRAVGLLGMRSLRNMLLCAVARACVPAESLGGLDLAAFWEDSLRRAVANRLVAGRMGLGMPVQETAFTLGLLQDVGVLVLARSNPDAAARWSEHRGDQPDERRALERTLFGTTHDALAEELARAWHLPDEVAGAMRYHHDPAGAPPRFGTLALTANVGEALAAVLSSDDPRRALERARQLLALVCETCAGGADDLIGALGAEVERTASALGMEVGAQPTLEQILREANRGLVEMNLSYEELVAELERTIAEKERLARELEQRNRDLEQLSITDPLTGLPNRRAFSGRLSYEVARVARSGGEVCVLYGDIDHFKKVNDTWGHDFGDEVLRTVAVVVGQSLRQTDFVARVGGEEFGIVLPDTPLSGGKVVGEKLLAALRAAQIRTPTKQRRAFTMSLGLAAAVGPADPSARIEAMAKRLVKAADKALYVSKSEGRDRLTVVDAPLPWP